MRLGVGLAAALLLLQLVPFGSGKPPGPGIQAAIIDDFSDGDYTNNPTWTMSAGNFTVVSEALKNEGGWATEEISTPYTQTYGTWEVRFRHSVVTPNSNKMRFHVMASSTSLSSSNGYYFISNSGSGTIFGQPYVGLVRNSGAGATFIIDSDGNPVAWSANTAWHTAQITRASSSDWSIYVDGVQYGPTVYDN